MTTHMRMRQSRTAIRTARLFDGVTTIADPLVLIEDGRITEVRTGAPPPDAELIELPGATLLPGLIDTHVHVAFDGGPDPVAALSARDDDAVLEAMAQAAAAQLRAGVTTVRDLSCASRRPDRCPRSSRQARRSRRRGATATSSVARSPGACGRRCASTPSAAST
jgi:imidazolonepropionase-like amidohydrolase